MSLPNLRSQLRDLEVNLDVNNTVWKHIVARIPFLYNFGCCYNKISSYHRHIIYVVIIVVCATIACICNDLVASLIIDCLFLIFLIVILLDCNYFIMCKGLTKFDVYYKAINICIAMIAFRLSTNLGKEEYTCLLNNCLVPWILEIHSILGVTNNTLTTILVSLMDGYNMSAKLKITSLICAVIYFTYLLFLVYFDTTTTTTTLKNDYIRLFGINYESLHSITVSALLSVIVFMLRQLYFVVRSPNKLILIPNYVAFKDINQNRCTINLTT